MNKNLFLTFIFSLIPGAGQMYQEYMKRGLSILTIFVICIGISIVVNMSAFLIPIPIIIIYSFFDNFKLRNMSKRGEELLEDRFIWEEIENEGNFFSNIFRKRNLLLGIILIVIGIYFFLDSFLLKVLHGTNINVKIINAIYYATRYTPTLFVSIISIGVGTKLISNKEEK